MADSAQKVEDMAGGLLKGMMTGKDVSKVMNVVSVGLMMMIMIMMIIMIIMIIMIMMMIMVMIMT